LRRNPQAAVAYLNPRGNARDGIESGTFIGVGAGALV
jgi:hypothetical protein